MIATILNRFLVSGITPPSLHAGCGGSGSQMAQPRFLSVHSFAAGVGLGLNDLYEEGNEFAYPTTTVQVRQVQAARRGGLSVVTEDARYGTAS